MRNPKHDLGLFVQSGGQNDTQWWFLICYVDTLENTLLRENKNEHSIEHKVYAQPVEHGVQHIILKSSIYGFFIPLDMDVKQFEEWLEAENNRVVVERGSDLSIVFDQDDHEPICQITRTQLWQVKTPWLSYLRTNMLV